MAASIWIWGWRVRLIGRVELDTQIDVQMMKLRGAIYYCAGLRDQRRCHHISSKTMTRNAWYWTRHRDEPFIVEVKRARRGRLPKPGDIREGASFQPSFTKLHLGYVRLERSMGKHSEHALLWKVWGLSICREARIALLTSRQWEVYPALLP